MKKYIVLGVTVMALAAVLFCLHVPKESIADDTCHAFYGVFESGRTVGAQQGIFWIEGVDKENDTYYIDIPTWMTGYWVVTDGCQHFQRYWDGENCIRVDFCNPQTCECN